MSEENKLPKSKLTLSERISRMEQLIDRKKAKAAKLTAEIKSLNEKLSALKKLKTDEEYAYLRKLIESKGFTPEDVLSMLN